MTAKFGPPQRPVLHCDTCGAKLDRSKSFCDTCGENRPACPNCGDNLRWVVEYPSEGTGCLLVVLGFLFAPIVIGIPIFIYGFVLYGKSTKHWHCPGCGAQFPAKTGPSAPERTFDSETWV